MSRKSMSQDVTADIKELARAQPYLYAVLEEHSCSASPKSLLVVWDHFTTALKSAILGVPTSSLAQRSIALWPECWQVRPP